MNSHDQSGELRKIETVGAPPVAELTRAVQAELATALAALPRMTRRVAGRKIQPHVVDSFERVVHGKLAAAAEAEIATFVVTQLAQRQVATVQHLRNESAMRGIVAMTLSETATQLFDILASHEDSIDTVGGRWSESTRKRLAGGVIDQAEADRRLARIGEAGARMQQMLETEVDALIGSFREQMRNALAALGRTI